MAEGNHFLNIPHQEGLFTTIKSGRSDDRRDCEAEDEDDEEAEEDVRLIPRCSPIPRKRGSSIIDETAEYMRIRLVLARRVSFADASGSDLADVREFVPFDSDDEDETWEEEEEKLRRSYQEPVYKVWPEIHVRTGNELIQAVHANKVEVEGVTAVPDDQLAFDVLICVLNVSYHKSVFVRSTTDGWITYSESPALYVPESNDGDTDRFSARFSFTEPYLFNGARIDFVVRYETPDGEFWANNLRKNYSVTLLVSYEDTSQVKNVAEDRDIKGILKPPRNRMEYVNDLCQDQDEDDFDSEERPAGVSVSSCICPVVIEPEIDIEIAEAKSVSSSKISEDPNPADWNLQVSDTIQLTDHIQHTSQATDSELFSKSISISLQKCTDVRIEPLADHLTAYPDKLSEESANSTQCSSENQDDALSDVTTQVPFDVGISLPAMFSSTQRIDEDQKEEENKELTSSGAQLQDQASYKQHVDKTKILLPELQESIKPCTFSEFEISNASKVEDFSHSTDHILVDDSCNNLIQAKMLTHHEFKEQGQADLGVESLQLHQGEVPVIATTCMWEPFEVTQSNPQKTSLIMVNINELDHASKDEEHFIYDTIHDSLSSESQTSIVEIPRIDSEEPEAAVRLDTDQEEQVDLRGEDNYKKCPEELTDINICRRQPKVLTYFEQSCTFEESVAPNVSNSERTPDPELTVYLEQRRESESGLKGLADFKSEDKDNFGEKPRIDSEEHKAAVRGVTDEEEQVGISKDSDKKCPEELTYVNICRQHPEVVTHIEQSCTFEEIVPQNVSNSERTSDPDLTEYPAQRRESDPDLNRSADFKSETGREELVGIKGENCKHCPLELSEKNICWRQPHVLTHFEPSYTFEDSVPQTVSDSKRMPELADDKSDQEVSFAIFKFSETTSSRASNFKDVSQSKGHNIMYTDLKNTLVKEPEMQTPLVDDHLEQTTEPNVFLSFSNLPTSYPEISENHGQLQDSGSKLELDVPSEEISLPTFLCETTTISQDFFTTVEAVSSEGEDGNSTSTQEELEDLSFNEEFELFYEEPAPRQKQEDLKSQLLLPSTTLQASSAQCNTILGQVLIPSLVVFSTVVCLVIGFNEPIVYLFVALFLVSLCF